MDGMTAPAHAKPALRDHMWVLAVIAGFALYDVWESWTQVGNKSGFAHGTGWTLTVIVEAYAAYALFGWFSAPGRRSRRYAMWSALGVLCLSLIGQGASSVAADAVPPMWLRVFVKDLPVVVLALIALLVHLRRLDREDATAAERARLDAAQEAAAEAVAADERTVLRAELEAARDALEPLRADLETARGEIACEAARAEAAEGQVQKLKAATARKRVTATARKRGPATGRKQETVTGSATAPEPDAVTAPADPLEEAPADLDSEAKVLWYLDKGYSASRAGIAAGLTDSRGRQIARELAKTAPRGQDSDDQQG